MNYRNDSSCCPQKRAISNYTTPLYNVCHIENHHQHRTSSLSSNVEYLQINVGGRHFVVPTCHLTHFPQSRLSRLHCAIVQNDHESISCLCDDVDLTTGFYFFDRDSRVFEQHVFTWLLTRRLRVPSWEMCVMRLDEELQYWGVQVDALESCCHEKYMGKKENLTEVNEEIREVMLAMGLSSGGSPETTLLPEELSGEQLTWRQRLWRLMEKPKTSFAAKMISYVCVCFIFVSTANLLISTLPGMHHVSNSSRSVSANIPPSIYNSSSNFLHVSFQTLNYSTIEPSTDSEFPLTSPSHGAYFTFNELSDGDIFEKIEFTCILWFTLEFLLRLVACPDYRLFFRSLLNWIDVISVVPFYISLAFVYVVDHKEDSQQPQLDEDQNVLLSIGKVVQVFRVLRILRVLKLARHSTGLLALGFTLRKCYSELLMLLLVMSMAVLIFSALIHFIEREGDELSSNSGSGRHNLVHTPGGNFSSILSSSWWVVITMTTVGYGDQVPKTWLGKCVGGLCSMCGVLLIALPVPFIVNSFRLFYQHQTRCTGQSHMKRKCKVMSQQQPTNTTQHDKVD